MNGKLLNEKEVAAYLGMSMSWIRHSRTLGNGPAFIKVGRHVKYKIEDVDAFVAQNRCLNTDYTES